MRDLRHKIPREVWSLEMITDEVIDTILGSDREREDYDDWKPSKSHLTFGLKGRRGLLMRLRSRIVRSCFIVTRVP